MLYWEPKILYSPAKVEKRDESNGYLPTQV